jgi:hypothetical protein
MQKAISRKIVLLVYPLAFEKIFIAGLIEGINFPKRNKPIVDLEGCTDIIIVGTKYFLENKSLIEAWALHCE